MKRRAMEAGMAAAVILLTASCASSERMMRMSGGLSSYQAPREERVKGYASSHAQRSPGAKRHGDLIGLNDTLVNLWPLFFRSANYYSALWPFFDRDPYGMAFRPFYNQEGNEYSVLFPLSAWNPATKDGWALNTYWSPSGFGFAPLFHYGTGKQFSFYGPFWGWEDSFGFFPLCSFGPRINYCVPGWWDRQKGNWGVFPLAWVFKDKGGCVAPCWWEYHKGNLRSGGIFPVVWWTREGFRAVLPAWWCLEKDGALTSAGVFPVALWTKDFKYFGPLWGINSGEGKWREGGIFPVVYLSSGRSWVAPFYWGERTWSHAEDFGVFPIFYFRDRAAQYLFPLYVVSDNGDFVLTPLVGWKNTPDDRMRSLLGPLWFQRTKNNPAVKADSLLKGSPLAGSDFLLAGALFYSGSERNWRWPADGIDLTEINPKNFAGKRYQIQCAAEDLGIGRKLSTYADFEATKPEFLAKAEIREKKFGGLFPLFHYSSSRKESSWNALLFAGFYQRNSRKTTLGFPLLFSGGGKERQRRAESFRFNSSPKQIAVDRKEFWSLPLLSGWKETRFYPPSPRYTAWRTLYGYANNYNTNDANYFSMLRVLADAELERLKPGLRLPAEVCSGAGFKLFLDRLPEELLPPTGNGNVFGVIPLWFRETEGEKSQWIFPLLLSAFRHSPEETRGMIFPLLTFWRKSATEEVLGNPLYSSGGGRFPKRFRLVERTKLSEAPETLAESTSHQLFALLFRSEKNHFRVALPAVDSAALERKIHALRALPGKTDELNRTEAKRALLERALRAGENEKSIKSGWFREKSTELATLLRQRESLEVRLKDLRKLCGTVSPDAACAEAERLWNENSRSEAVERFSSFLWNRTLAPGFKSWNILRFVASAENDRNRDVERYSVLEYLYRHRREGKRSNTICFPFYSERRDGENYEWGFLYRLFGRYRRDGKSGYRLLFMTFPDK